MRLKQFSTIPGLRGLLLTGLLLDSLLASGCFFSSLAGAGDGSASSSSATALAADVVTLPIQAPFYLDHLATEHQRKEQIADGKKVEEYRKAIQLNPALPLDEKWISSNDDLKIRAFEMSLEKDGALYSPALLERVYQEAPAARKSLFCNASCPPDFIAAHYREIFTTDRRLVDCALDTLIANPNTPVAVQELLFNEAPEYRGEIFASPACTSPDFIATHFPEVFLQDRDPFFVVRSLIANPHTPLPILEQVFQEKPMLRNAILQSPACTSPGLISRLFEKMAAEKPGPSKANLFCLIENGYTPLPVLQQIVQDEQTYPPEIREYAARIVDLRNLLNRQKQNGDGPAAPPSAPAF